MNRILVRGVNWLGDAVMTTPALQRLRECFPQAHLAMLTPAKLAELWRGQRFIDQLIPIEPGSSPWAVARNINQSFATPPSNREPSSAARAAFDLALVFPNSPRAAFEVWLARIPRRVGYARPWRKWLLTQNVPDRPNHVRMAKRSSNQVRRLVAQAPQNIDAANTIPSGSHQLHEYLHLAAAVGADPTPTPPELDVTADELAAATRRLASLAHSSPDTLWLGINPSATYGPAKRWPPESFAATIRAVSRQVPGAAWVLFGAAADQPLCRQIATLAGGEVLNLAGQTSLRELMAGLKVCRVLLTNDSGPMHLAAALGTSVIALFGSTSPVLTGPGLPGDARHQVLTSAVPCAPCFRRDCPIDLRCLTGIAVDAVATAVLRAASRAEPRSPR